ncbi:MAG: hypothetical protein ACOC44_20285 [Promethearchaeia archaeon]
MPIRIRWASKEYLGIALMLLGGCGLIQLFIILFSQFVLNVRNYLVITVIPIGSILAIFFGCIIIYESFAQVKRRKNLKNQFRKSNIENKTIRKIVEFPVSKPLLLTLLFFSILYLVSYFIANIFLNNILSFIIGENVATIGCLLIANLLEKNYARVRRY